MKSGAITALTVLLLLALAGACAPSTPTVAPTKPAAAPTSAASAGPTAAVPAVTAAPKAAATSAPTAAAKPVAPAATAIPVAKIKRGGTLRSVQKYTIDSLDPHLATTRGSFGNLIYDTLMAYKLVDPKQGRFEPIPGMAESLKVIDPTTIELKLRKGVKFHDGTSLTSDVVKWNLERAGKHAKSQVKLTVSAIKDIQTIDDLTLRLILTAPSSVLALNLSPLGVNSVYIVSKDAVEKLGDDKYGSNPVGTGTAKLREWVRDQRMVLDKVPGHWELGDDGQPLPYLDSFIDITITDQTVALVELKTGNIDLVPDIELKDVLPLRSNSDIVISDKFGDEAWMSYPGMYFNPKLNYAFSDKKLREAAQYALDRDSIAQALGFGVGQAAYYPLWFPGMLGYDEGLPKRTFDLNKAKTLLTEAGYPNGVDVEVKVINRPSDVRPLEVVQEMWRKANIRLKINQLDRLVWISSGRENDFEILSHSFKSRVDPHLAQYTRTGSPSNYPNYSNTEADKLWAQAEQEYDSNKRGELYKQIQKYIYEDAYHMIGYMHPAPAARNKKVHDFLSFFGYRYVWKE